MIKSLVTGTVLVYIRNSVSILLVVHPSQVVLEVKNLPTNAGDARDAGFFFFLIFYLFIFFFLFFFFNFILFLNLT